MHRAADLALRLVGGLVALAAGGLTALFEVFYSPLAIGDVIVPVTIPVALITNVALVWFGYQATGSKLFALVPGLFWMGLMITASARTAEGDAVLTDWRGLLTLFAGVAGYTFAARRLILPPRRPSAPRPPASGPSAPPDPAGG